MRKLQKKTHLSLAGILSALGKCVNKKEEIVGTENSTVLSRLTTKK